MLRETGFGESKLAPTRFEQTGRPELSCLHEFARSSIRIMKAYMDELERPESILLALTRSIEANDPYTEGHSDSRNNASSGPPMKTEVWGQARNLGG